MFIFSWLHGSLSSMFDHSSPTKTGINPASGLPMADGVDIHGNPYGTNYHSQQHHSHSGFDDHWIRSGGSSGGSSGSGDW
jgi:hypothetical protein